MSDSVEPHRQQPTRLSSLGFSRQEHWSGLPFPSPVHESERWKWSRSVMSNSSQPHGLQPTRLLRPWDFPGKSTGVGCHCLLHITLPMIYQKKLNLKQIIRWFKGNKVVEEQVKKHHREAKTSRLWDCYKITWLDFSASH